MSNESEKTWSDSEEPKTTPEWIPEETSWSDAEENEEVARENKEKSQIIRGEMTQRLWDSDKGGILDLDEEKDSDGKSFDGDIRSMTMRIGDYIEKLVKSNSLENITKDKLEKIDWDEVMYLILKRTLESQTQKGSYKLEYKDKEDKVVIDNDNNRMIFRSEMEYFEKDLMISISRFLTEFMKTGNIDAVKKMIQYSQRRGELGSEIV